MKTSCLFAIVGLALVVADISGWAQGGPPPGGRERPTMGGPPGGGGQQPPGERPEGGAGAPSQQPPAGMETEGNPPAGESDEMLIGGEGPTQQPADGGTDTDPETSNETPIPVLINLPPIPGAETETEADTGADVMPATLAIRPGDDAESVHVEVVASPGTEWQLQVTSDLQQWSDLASVVVGDAGVGGYDLAISDVRSHYIRGLSVETASSGGSEPEVETPVAEETNIYALFTDNVEVFEEGEFIVLRSTGVPNHPSPYYGVGDPLYEAYNGDNPSFRQNPNVISEQDLVFRIPKNPTVASNHAATPLGPIGISINGVALFNQYAGPNNQPLTNEINSFDQYGGHPQNRGTYHYHVEPLYLTGQVGRDGFLGLLLDGFPVYGPEENGVEITNADLDEFHGHFGPTKHFPEGIYHYHFTDEDPYLNGAGYYGTAGSVTQ